MVKKLIPVIGNRHIGVALVYDAASMTNNPYRSRLKLSKNNNVKVKNISMCSFGR